MVHQTRQLLRTARTHLSQETMLPPPLSEAVEGLVSTVAGDTRRTVVALVVAVARQILVPEKLAQLERLVKGTLVAQLENLTLESSLAAAAAEPEVRARTERYRRNVAVAAVQPLRRVSLALLGSSQKAVAALIARRSATLCGTASTVSVASVV